MDKNKQELPENITMHELTVVSKVRFVFKKGDTDSTAIGGLHMLYADGQIDENIFVDVVEGKKSLNKKGMHALQRVLSYCVAQNIKHLENSGHQKAEDRDMHCDKMVQYIKKELGRMDAVNLKTASIVDESRKK